MAHDDDNTLILKADIFLMDESWNDDGLSFGLLLKKDDYGSHHHVFIYILQHTHAKGYWNI